MLDQVNTRQAHIHALVHARFLSYTHTWSTPLGLSWGETLMSVFVYLCLIFELNKCELMYKSHLADFC